MPCLLLLLLLPLLLADADRAVVEPHLLWMHQSRVHVAGFESGGGIVSAAAAAAQPWPHDTGNASIRTGTSISGMPALPPTPARLSLSHISICASTRFHAEDHFVCPTTTWAQASPLITVWTGRHAAVLRADVSHAGTSSAVDRALIAVLEALDNAAAEGTNGTTCAAEGGHLASFWALPLPRAAESTITRSISNGNDNCGAEWARCVLATQSPTPHQYPLSEVRAVMHTLRPSPSPSSPTPPPRLPAHRQHAIPDAFGVEHIQIGEIRRTWLSFIETNSKVNALATAGVRAKEVYAMIVDNIGNMMPEIITQLISMLIKIPLVTLIGQLLSALLPDALVPNSGSTPEVPIVPGIDPIKPDPAPKCKCKNGASFSLLEAWRQSRQPHTAPPTLALVEEEEFKDGVWRRTEAGMQCDCGGPQQGASSVSDENPEISRAGSIGEIPMSFTETLEDITAAQGARRRRVDTQDPVSGGGANGGPIAKIEPKVRDQVVDGLLSNCMPELQQKLAAKIITLWPVVKFSIYRGSVRGLTRSLTRAITQSLVDALLDKLFAGLTKYATRELTTRITSGLTHSLAATMTHALSRSPKSDYYCHYCREHQLYCNECQKATLKEYQTDYYVSYYASYVCFCFYLCCPREFPYGSAFLFLTFLTFHQFLLLKNTLDQILLDVLLGVLRT